MINTKTDVSLKIYNILYLGDSKPHSTSRHRADALQRLGNIVDVVDPYEFLQPLPRYIKWLAYRTGYRPFSTSILKSIKTLLPNLSHSYDLIWVNGGELLGPSVLRWLKQAFQCPVILYQNDDPTNSRDGARFNSLLDSLPLYDLCVCVRPDTALEILASQVPKTLRVLMSYDEREHASHSEIANAKVSPSVAFVGTLIPGEGRDQFLLSLINAGIPLKIRGNKWQAKLVEPSLQASFVGAGVTGQAYTQALRSASACLGLLSHLNRDLHTRRSVEIPACGGLFCAERTSEHQLLYEEGVEAVFWDTAEECAEKCITLLADPELNHSIRSAGSRRVREMGVGNEDICRQILTSVP